MGHPFSRIPYTGSTPGADGNTYNLLNTATGLQWPVSFFAQGAIHKVLLDLKYSQAGTLKWYKSTDTGANRGTASQTWQQIGQEAIAAPASTAGLQREFLVEAVGDFKLDWVNGGSAQSPFIPDIALTDQRASSGVLLAGTATVGGTPGGAMVAELQYNLTPPTFTDGQFGPLQGDANGYLRNREQYQPVYENNTDGVASTHDKPVNATTYNATAYDIIAKATAGNIKASAGCLYRLYVTNDNAATQAYALVNKASAAVTGDTPIMYFYVPTKTTLLLEWKYGKRFSAGIAWAQVTTFGAGTITTTTSDSLVNAEYV